MDYNIYDFSSGFVWQGALTMEYANLGFRDVDFFDSSRLRDSNTRLAIIATKREKLRAQLEKEQDMEKRKHLELELAKEGEYSGMQA